MANLKRVLSHLVVVAAAASLFACNLATIDAPLNFQKHPSEPVDILVLLEPGADPETFAAFLNTNNITGLFSFDAELRIMKAKVSTADGLELGGNHLATMVRGQSMGIPFTDKDGSFFYVEEGGVATNRDDKGVWFITGPEDASYYEIAEAGGYTTAQDRLWQMETYRRAGRGRLCEIQGPGMLTTDIFVRSMAYSDDELLDFIDALDPEVQETLQGYVDGINRRIQDLRANPEHIPLEFQLIDLNRIMSGDPTPTLQPFSVLDICSWLVLLLRNFDSEAQKQREIDNAALLMELQAKFPVDFLDMFNDLRWIDDPDALTYIPPAEGEPVPAPTSGSVVTASKATASVQPMSRGAVPAFPDFPDLRQTAANMAEMRETVVESLKSLNAYVTMGSYAWVVAGSRTASGNPIHYAGPQMGFPTPSYVVEGSIQAGGLNVSGMTVPGMPSLIISRTPHHSISMQVGHANTVDFYMENPSDVFLHRTETIKVLGGADVVLPIYRTARGPLINPLPYNPETYDPASDGPILSWKYSHWGYELDTMGGFFDLMRATSMDEFGDGIEKVAVSQHFCYADRDGNIAYWMSGRDPVRPPGEWRLPQGLLGPPGEWDPEVLIPRITDRNTSQGFYCGWNNKSAPGTGGFSGSYHFGPFHRAHVIHDYLAAHDNLTFEDVRNLALYIAATDSFNSGGNPWKFVEGYFTEVVDAYPTPEREAALALLADWDGHFVAGGTAEWAFGTNRADAWILMDQWIREVVRLTFEDELGPKLNPYEQFNVLLHGLPGTTLNNSYDWFQNLSDPSAPQTADEIILAALDHVLAALGPQPWGTGARGQITFNHPVLAALGSGTVHVMPFSCRSTYAQCVEYGPAGPVRIESMLPLGQSGMVLGNPVSFGLHPHFKSMTSVFDGFVHRPFPLFD